MKLKLLKMLNLIYFKFVFFVTERHYVCEDETMLIDCKGKYINIHGAVWGNMNPKLCTDMEAEINGIEP